MDNNKIESLNHLLKKNALIFEDTKLKSGRISPYYLSLRKAMEDNTSLDKISELFTNTIINRFGKEFNYIYGPAYTGIPLAAAIALKLLSKHKLQVKFGYDRKEAKDYGNKNENMIIGSIEEGDKIIVVDDVLTTGKTKIESINKIRTLQKNIEIIGIVVFLDRQEIDENNIISSDNLKNNGIMVESILNIKEVYNWLLEKRINNKTVVDKNTYDKFERYMKINGN